MPKTNAERRRAWRQRRTGRIADLEAEAAELRDEVGNLRPDLATALEEAERLAAAAYKHPAGAVDGGTCQACGITCRAVRGRPKVATQSATGVPRLARLPPESRCQR